MGMVSEFKEFIARGNVIDLATAVVIGGAFGKITTALVDGIIMPIVGMALGKVDFSQLFIALDGHHYANLAAAQEAAAPVLTYGAFIQTVLDFLLIAFVIFMMLKGYNRLKKEQEEAPVEDKPAEPSEEVVLLREIRDALARPRA
ncbi:large conductance mechanosensitive channel protein MscL [Lysobacter sp. GX 14042]|uniref:large conductance mechanosensitive channel protein MscL n=1 Tax=Lysobacter sp. GX 14042 TaxID=2907155 RepID=UPI001F1E0384|nr:large conductance mechanosensitive channel protein MscL [Lysobacter sp. GX 14042]MCE7031944.1 large conductance mechanosensitive channel protein MscL [Lysobacter sp. GX 14042]